MKNETPEQILAGIYKKASVASAQPFIKKRAIAERIETVCRTQHASIRLLMSCLLGKLIDPKVDPRKPYTEIQDADCFSGRTIDEKYLATFISQHDLPCRSTTAFLTPVFRTMNRPLTLDIKLESRYQNVISATIQLLDDVVKKRVSAEDLLSEIVRVLIGIRDDNKARMEILLKSMRMTAGSLTLSSNDILILIRQHLLCKNSSRLPVLIVAAAYRSVENKIGERVLSLNSHHAADLQTGALGDVEICLENDDAIVTVYEMKMKRISKSDIDLAVEKILRSSNRIHNYIFITTEKIESECDEYASEFYEKTGGTEIAILDCLGFVKHFLHFFHRFRRNFLDHYQELVLEAIWKIKPVKHRLFVICYDNGIFWCFCWVRVVAGATRCWRA